MKFWNTTSAAIFLAAICVFKAYSEFSPYALVYNRTASIPLGIYFGEKVSRTELKIGDTACFPYHAPAWAEDRHYFPEGFTLCKHVYGMPGDKLQIQNGELDVFPHNGEAFKLPDAFAEKDSKARALAPALTDGMVLQDGQYLLLAPAHKNSLDSRYLGPVTLPDSTMRVKPLLTWD